MRAPLVRSSFASLAGALVTLVGLATLVAGFCAVAYLAPGPAPPRGSPDVVVLRRGSGLAEIAATLQRAHVIASEPLFLAAAQLTGAARRLKPGEYRIPRAASLREVLRRIRNGEVLHHRITIPEGFTVGQVIDVLTRSGVLGGPAPPAPSEGALLPETYDVLRGESRTAVLQRMIDARDHLLAQLWTHRRAGLPYTSVDEAVILASIVEKETAKPAERPRVAAVYLNRLRTGMNLDADPTVIYGLNKGLPLGRGLSLSELQNPTPYNTYVHAGLPPTPIDNPGRASLAAAMDPPTTSELYFVADGTGGHVFAATLDEQSRNVAKWRRLQRERQDTAPTPSPHEHR